MKLLSELTREQLAGTVGKAVAVQDARHILNGAEGVVTGFETSKSYTVNHSVIGHLIPDGDSVTRVIMRMPLINGHTGGVEDKQLELKPGQLGLVEPAPKPKRPASKGPAVDIPYTELRR